MSTFKGLTLACTQVRFRFHDLLVFCFAQRWMFSTAFTPITRWGFEENPHMGTHLRTCPFYRAEHREGAPVLLPGMEGDDHTTPHVQAALKRMYPGFVTYQQMMGDELEEPEV